MGMFDFVGSLKNKAKDATMDKVLEKMRDLKMPTSQKKVNKNIETHVETLDGVKSAKVSINSDGLVIKVSFSDKRDTIKRTLGFEELIWTSHKRAFVFKPDTPFDYMKDQAAFACVITTIATVLQQMLGFNDKKLKEENFSTDISMVTGVMEKDGKLYYEMKRIPLLRQYVNYRVMGQAPMDHLNVIDCWFENGKIIVRIDNNRLVDQIRGMDLDPAELRQMMKGDMSGVTGEEQQK
ncbi:MAG: hypothetical protein KAS17_11270 [Victivallaceae bacterium]|nr:hypothetical protein [Victivallaceae bacterium]